MKVYVVIYDSPYDPQNRHVEGVWATREAAVEYVRQQPGAQPSRTWSSGFRNYELDEFELRG